MYKMKVEENQYAMQEPLSIRFRAIMGRWQLVSIPFDVRHPFRDLEILLLHRCLNDAQRPHILRILRYKVRVFRLPFPICRLDLLNPLALWTCQQIPLTIREEAPLHTSFL